MLRVAFSPSLILRKLALVSLLQLLAYAVKLLLRAQRHGQSAAALALPQLAPAPPQRA